MERRTETSDNETRGGANKNIKNWKADTKGQKFSKTKKMEDETGVNIEKRRGIGEIEEIMT